mgnify:CR=1 FL=1
MYIYYINTRYISTAHFSEELDNNKKMGTILSSKKEGEKVVLQIATDYDEFLQLKGHLNDIRLVTENVAEVKANISQRGRNEATK